MLKWIGKMLGGTQFVLPENVPNEWASELQSFVEPVDKLKGCSGMPRDILGYVFTGEPISVLHSASKHPEVGECLKITGYHYGHKTIDRPKIYKQFEQVNAGVMLRWAKFMEACVDQNSTRSYAIQLPNNIHWPEILLFHS